MLARLVLTAFLVLVPAARASEVVFEDPRDSTAGDARDIERVAVSWDAASGTMSVALTTYAAPSAETAAKLYAGLFVAPGVCPAGQPVRRDGLTEFAALADYPPDAAPLWAASCVANRSRAPGQQPTLTRAVSADGRTRTVVARDPLMAGFQACFVGPVQLQRSDVYDAVPDDRATMTRFPGPECATAPEPGPPPTPAPPPRTVDPGPEDGATPAARVLTVGRPTLLRATRQRRIRIPAIGHGPGTARVWLHRGRLTLARGTVRVGAGTRYLELRVTKAVARRFAGRTLAAALTVTTLDGTERRALRVRLARR